MPLNRLLIKKPLISEKATALAAAGKYVFLVDEKSNKKQIKQLIEAIYKVHPVKMNVVRIASRGNNYKKVIVTLKEGETIDVIPR